MVIRSRLDSGGLNRAHSRVSTKRVVASSQAVSQGVLVWGSCRVSMKAVGGVRYISKIKIVRILEVRKH